jgi:predicted RNase H-like nuclease
MYFVGVDGCRGQCWLAVILGAGGCAEARVFSDIFALWQECKAASLILIDIPIGLRNGGALERRCDKEARKRLGPKRGAGVFPMPCRAALKADSYEEASEINREHTGRKLSKQSWGILLKIRQVEELVAGDAGARARIRESHPEVCFLALAGYPMEYRYKALMKRRRTVCICPKRVSF